jgi:3'(2'), 5'-bisphosphate nucleotidase
MLDNLIEISRLAGDEILDVYDGTINVTLKDDLSPLTDADRKSNTVITDRLSELYPDIPILSEEGQEIHYNDRKEWNLFWLIDPLDGTKEFIKRNGEFTVNIALIEEGEPIAGVVYAPTKDTFWYGARDIGSFTIKGDALPKKISVIDNGHQPVKIVSSRSHPSEKLQNYLDRFENHEILNMGSSLKICLVADGSAHIYPRLGPTMEWDSGAGHAVLRYAGGFLTDTSTEQELIYNKENLRNPDFICYGSYIKEHHQVL